MKISLNKNSPLAFFNDWFLLVAWTILVLFSLKVPVFWDMYAEVKTAVYFIYTNWSDLLPNGNGYVDNGHIPIYPLYLSGLFKIFGYHLYVAHLSVLPFLFVLNNEISRLTADLRNQFFRLLLLVLILLMPFISPAIINFNREIAFLSFSIGFYNAIKSRIESRILLFSLLLVLFNQRGIFLVIGGLIYSLLYRSSQNAIRLKFFFPAFVFFIIWMLFHYLVSGWFILNPANSEHRSFIGISQVFRNLLFSLWKLADLGMFMLWLPLLFIANYRVKWQQDFRLFTIFLLVTIMMLLPFSNPVSHRYFLLFYLVLPVFVFKRLALFRNQMISRSWIVTIFMVVISGHFWLYPNRYGNSWESQFRSVRSHKVRRLLDDYTIKKGIPPDSISAGFQLYFNSDFYLMDQKSREYQLLQDTGICSSPYLAESNLPNNFSPYRREWLNKLYVKDTSMNSGVFYLDIYRKKSPY